MFVIQVRVQLNSKFNQTLSNYHIKVLYPLDIND